jgi:hypothetical protein
MCEEEAARGHICGYVSSSHVSHAEKSAVCVMAGEI